MSVKIYSCWCTNMKLYIENRKTKEVVQVIDDIRTITDSFDSVNVVTYNRESYVLMKELFNFTCLV